LLEGPDAVLAASTDEDPADVVKPASAAPARARASVPDRRVHRVRSGETLFSIARLYRTTVASIREWNNLRGTTIRVGQRLTIRGAGVQAD
jgi:membrane-bound lytic murein transglycosylase D